MAMSVGLFHIFVGLEFTCVCVRVWGIVSCNLLVVKPGN